MNDAVGLDSLGLEEVNDVVVVHPLGEETDVGIARSLELEEVNDAGIDRSLALEACVCSVAVVVIESSVGAAEEKENAETVGEATTHRSAAAAPAPAWVAVNAEEENQSQSWEHQVLSELCFGISLASSYSHGPSKRSHRQLQLVSVCRIECNPLSRFHRCGCY